MRKTDPKKQYNPSLQTFIPDSIRDDKNAYKEVWTYIQENLWKYMDKDRVKKAVFVLDDPLQEYGNDIEMVKVMLRHFLPKVKKILNVDDKHPLKDRIDSKLKDKHLLDRLINQQINLYREQRNTWWLITKILQEGPAIDMNQPHKKQLTTKLVPQTQKTIIANILTFMILEEELQKAW